VYRIEHIEYLNGLAGLPVLLFLLWLLAALEKKDHCPHWRPYPGQPADRKLFLPPAS
jgi:hypothetical protein